MRWGDVALRSVRMLGVLPRSTPTVAAVLFLVASAGYGIQLSGKGLDVLDHMTRDLGGGIETVEITGQAQVSEQAILDLLKVEPGMSLLAYDLAGGRQRLISNPWILSARLQKLYPGALKVTITERQPYALWQPTSGDPVYIIQQDGHPIVAYTPGQFAGLPLVLGVGADTRVGEAQAIIKAVPELAPKVKASILVSERRWDLVLDNGVRLLLPEEHPEKALAKIAALDKEQNVFGREIALVDLRIVDQIVLRLTDAAMQQRQQMISDRDKAAKGGRV